VVIRQKAAQFAASLGIAGLGAGFLASNFTAWKLGYQPALGAPLMHSAGWSIYPPWSILTWAKWQAAVPDIHTGLILGAAGLAVPVIGYMMKLGRKASAPEFGKSEWGTLADALSAGLLAKDGVVVGKMDGRLLRFDGDEHTLYAGASGSGKSQGPAASSLLSLRKRSVLVLDPKGEQYRITSKFRSTLGATFFFDPTKPDTAYFNPLAEIPIGSHREIGAVQNLTEVLIDSSGLKNSDPYWPIAASELLAGVVLFVLHRHPVPERRLGIVRSILFRGDATFEQMAASDIPEARRVAEIVLDMGDKQRDGITATARAALSLWADPLVDEITSRSHFKISDLVCSPYPMSLYLIFPASDRARLMPLFRLVLVQIFKAFLWHPDEMADGRKKLRRLQFVGEEFPAAGKLPGFAQDIQEIRGHGITAMLLCQSLQNLEHTYGSNAIRDNCHIVTAFASADVKSMKDVSDAVGFGVETKVSSSQKVGEWFGGTKSTSRSHRRLLEAGDVRMLGKDEAIILVTGCKPIRAQKVRWFREWGLRKLGVNLRKHPNTPLEQNAEILAMHAEERP